jgi:hypothetical protein
MKNVKFFVSVLVSVFLLVGSVSANEKTERGSSASAEVSLKKQVARVVSKISTEESGSVLVYFSVTSAKGFELSDVVGENAELVNEVKKALSDKNFKVESSLEGRYKVKISFASSYDLAYNQ